MEHPNTRPSAARRIGRSIVWILKTTFVSLLLFALLVGLALGGFLLFEELQRSLNNIVARATSTEQRVELLRSDVDSLMAGSPDQQRQVNELQARLNEMDTLLARLQGGLAADLAQQAQRLATLEAQTALALQSSQTVMTNTAMLENSLVALQGDINDNSLRIDSLGGEIDSVKVEITAVHASLRETAEADMIAPAELSHIQDTLALFRIWELLTRARVRLVTNNPGMARTDVDQVLRSLDALLTTRTGDEIEPLQRIRTRVALALDGLPDNPTVAALDLENAWDELDRLLTLRLMPETAAALDESVTTTPTPAAVSPTFVPPIVVVTPTAAPTAEPSPTPEPTTSP